MIEPMRPCPDCGCDAFTAKLVVDKTHQNGSSDRHIDYRYVCGTVYRRKFLNFPNGGSAVERVALCKKVRS